MKKLFTLLAALALLGNVAVGQTVVNSYQKISDTQGNFTGPLDSQDNMGRVRAIGDLDNDAVVDIIVGSPGDDDGGADKGALYVLFMNNNGTVKAEQKISSTSGGFVGPINGAGSFGAEATPIGDLNGDGVIDLAVGAPRDNDGGNMRGSVWILFMNPNGTVQAEQKISDTQGGFSGTLTDQCTFGNFLDSIGDLNNDGVPDLAVSSFQDDDGGTDRGAVWILFLDTNGTVKSHQKISSTQGGFNGSLANGDEFGSAVSCIGDIDGDQIIDLAIGARMDDDGGTDRGAIWILNLNTNGTVKGHQKISSTQGGFNGTLENGDWFGWATGYLGDFKGDGFIDLAVGARYDNDGGPERGAVWILTLNSNGTVASYLKISDTQGNFSGGLADFDHFSATIALLGDINGDGTPDIAVGSPGDDDGGAQQGAVWILFLDSSITIGVQENTLESRFTIYPNPTKGKFEVRSLELGVEKVEVYDLFGRLVLSSTTPQIDMRGYAKGMYVVKAGQAVSKLMLH